MINRYAGISPKSDLISLGRLGGHLKGRPFLHVNLTKEGFGPAVSEGMWKGKPLIGGAVGKIPLQIVHGVTGFLVHSTEGVAFRIRQSPNNCKMTKRMGGRGEEHVHKHFLITRQVRNHLTLCYAMESGSNGSGGLFL